MEHESVPRGCAKRPNGAGDTGCDECAHAAQVTPQKQRGMECTPIGPTRSEDRSTVPCSPNRFRLSTHPILAGGQIQQRGLRKFGRNLTLSSFHFFLLSHGSFFEGNGPARQGLCGLDFRPCLSSEPSSPPTRALATHDNSGAAGLRPPPLFSTNNPRLNFHAIRSAVRLPRASQPCSYPQAGTSSDRARCPTASGLSARSHAGCGSDGIYRRRYH